MTLEKMKITDTYFLIEYSMRGKGEADVLGYAINIVAFGNESEMKNKCSELNEKSDTDYCWYEVKRGKNYE